MSKLVCSSYNKYKMHLDFIKCCYMDILHKQTVSIFIKYSTISFKIRKDIAFKVQMFINTVYSTCGSRYFLCDILCSLCPYI